MGLLNAIRPKWKNSDADVRLAAAKEMQDTETLTTMIIDDTEWFVRHNALIRLRELDPEQKHYARLMHECSDEEIRRKVVKVMTDVSELEWSAKNDQYQYVRDAAEHRVAELKDGTWTGEGDLAR
jgi:replicative DNA helicase